MARPSAQQPPSALSFPSASRTSSLGFGFASPFPATRSPFGDVANNNIYPSTPTSFNPFASPTGFQASSSQAKPLNKARPIPSASNVTPRLLKRSRHSTSPSPPGSPTSSMSMSPHAGHKRLSISRPKKQRQEQAAAVSEDLDLGLMLATLPPSTHLQILTSLMAKDPSLRSTILAVTPAPDLAVCNDELHRIMDRISRQYGEPGQGRYLLSWGRAINDIVTFSRTATTYLAFFYTPHQGIPTGLPTLHNLLFTISKYTFTLVRLLPPNVDQSPATSALSQLVNSLVSRWREWVSDISKDVNEKGEMYPYSSVVGWGQNFNELVDPERNGPDRCPDPGPIRELAATISAIRDTFVAQIGWLAGPGGGMR